LRELRERKEIYEINERQRGEKITHFSILLFVRIDYTVSNNKKFHFVYLLNRCLSVGVLHLYKRQQRVPTLVADRLVGLIVGGGAGCA
jgi:uncharacterized membrane protein